MFRLSKTFQTQIILNLLQWSESFELNPNDPRMDLKVNVLLQKIQAASSSQTLFPWRELSLVFEDNPLFKEKARKVIEAIGSLHGSPHKHNSVWIKIKVTRLKNVAALVSCLNERNLQGPFSVELSLREKMIYSKDKEILALAISQLQHIPQLAELSLRENNIGDEGVCALAAQLKHTPKLTQLDLSGDYVMNNIGVEGMRALASGLKHTPQLTELNLWGNKIGDEGARVLAVQLKHIPELTELNLSGSDMAIDTIFRLLPHRRNILRAF